MGSRSAPIGTPVVCQVRELDQQVGPHVARGPTSVLIHTSAAIGAPTVETHPPYAFQKTPPRRFSLAASQTEKTPAQAETEVIDTLPCSLRLKALNSFPELLPFLCFCLPVFVFCLPLFHFLFGKRSPLTAHDFQRYKLTARIH